MHFNFVERYWNNLIFTGADHIWSTLLRVQMLFLTRFWCLIIHSVYLKQYLRTVSLGRIKQRLTLKALPFFYVTEVLRKKHRPRMTLISTVKYVHKNMQNRSLCFSTQNIHIYTIYIHICIPIYIYIQIPIYIYIYMKHFYLCKGSASKQTSVMKMVWICMHHREAWQTVLCLTDKHGLVFFANSLIWLMVGRPSL